MLQHSSSPGLAHAAKSILRGVAAALGDPGALLERLPTALHAEARMQFLAHSGRLTDVRSVSVVVNEDAAFSDCSEVLTKHLTNLQACTSLEFKSLANVAMGSWGNSLVRHWQSQLATLKSVVHADLLIGSDQPGVMGILAAVGTDMLQDLSFRLVSAALAKNTAQVEAVVKRARFLRQLSLQWRSYGVRFERLPPLISRLRYLQSLELRDLWYCAASPREMFPPSLTRLTLESCCLASNSSRQNLLIALGSCSLLRELKLAAINFADCGFVQHARVPHLPSLRRLEVVGRHYRNQVPALLAVRVVRECPPELQHLRLSQVPLGSAECMEELCEELAGGLRDKAAELRHLELSDCGLGVSEVREWCSTLHAMSQLTALHVAENGFSPRQKCDITAVVADLTTLRDFSM